MSFDLANAQKGMRTALCGFFIMFVVFVISGSALVIWDSIGLLPSMFAGVTGMIISFQAITYFSLISYLEKRKGNKK